MARGGKRTPTTPAPVSGPGSLSRRTDGPIRAPSGGEFGERQALENLQRAEPVPEGARSSSGAPGGSAPPAAPLPDDFAFGPTQRPTEPITSGVAPANSIMGQDVDAMTRVLYQMYPHPDLARLINPYRGP